MNETKTKRKEKHKKIGLHKRQGEGRNMLHSIQCTEQRIHCSKLVILLLANWQMWSLSYIHFRRLWTFFFVRRSFFRHHFVCLAKFPAEKKIQKLLTFAKIPDSSNLFTVFTYPFKIHWLSILFTLLLKYASLMQTNYNRQPSKNVC